MVSVTFVTTPDDGSCGIGTYTGDLVDSFPEDVDTRRLVFPSGELDPMPVLRAAVAAGLTDDDVVHVQHEYGLFGPMSLLSWPFFAVLSLLAALRGVPVVVTAHSAWYPRMVEESGFVGALKRLYIRLNNGLLVAGASRLVFLSENCQAEFHESVVPRCDTVLPHGVRVGEVREVDEAEAKATFGYDPDDVVVTEPGYLREQKGNHVFVDIARRLPEYEFLLAGGSQSGDEADPYRLRLQREAPENVRVTGVLPDEEFHAAFAATDLVVLPYIEMTQSGVFNWCAAYELPVAASDHERFRRLHEEWDCVALFDVDDVEAAGERVQGLLEDDAERERLSCAIADYREANDFRSVARDHVDIYEGLEN